MLKFHHVGLVVENLASSIGHYAELFGKSSVSEIYQIDSQKVSVCFIDMGGGNHIELVAPLGEDSKVYNLLKKRISYYHMGYKVPNLSEAVLKLEALNYKALEMFHSEAFNGAPCVFLFTPDTHLIELIEE